MNLKDILEQHAPSEHYGIVIITGSFRAGKSEFVHAASQIVVPQVEVTYAVNKGQTQQTTLTLGSIAIDDNRTLFLLACPGALRVDFLVGDLADRVVGSIVLVAGARPETFREARSILISWSNYENGLAPPLIAIGQQEHPDVWNMADIRTVFRLNANEPIAACVNTGPDSTRKVLLMLLEAVPHNISIEQTMNAIRDL